MSSDAFRRLRSTSPVVNQQPELPAVGKDVLLRVEGNFLRRAKLPLSMPSREPSLHRMAVHSTWAGASEIDNTSCSI